LLLAALGFGLGSDRAKLPLQQDLLRESDAQERRGLLALELYSYFIRKFFYKIPLSPARQSNFIEKSCGRSGTPDEMAKAIVFLASDDASYIARTELFVDGGIAQV